MQRRSIKREAILECLKQTRSHPTAEWVYAQLKPRYPDLSLGTVYRNLGQLKEAGLVRSVGVFGGQERFDADLSPHSHAYCVRCGRMIDLPDVELPESVFMHAASQSGFTVSRASLVLSGLCADCAREAEDHAI